MKVAAVVVNHNGGKDLVRCLEALAAQTVEVEVVVVDCASSDGSALLAANPPPGVTSVPLGANIGYAGGCAVGLSATGDAEVVGFFNPDCFLAPDFFAVCLAVFARDARIGGVAGRLLRPDGITVDSCGQVLTPLALRVHDRGYGRPAAGAFLEPAVVLAACGAAMVYRRVALEAAAVDGEVFPTEYFAFWEDLDLGWRVTNVGYRVVYEPAALAVHRRGATAEPGRGRLLLRRPAALAAGAMVNRWATLSRNLHWLDFLLRVPVLCIWDVSEIVWLSLRRPAFARTLFRTLPRLRLAPRQRGRLPQKRLRWLG
jgi:GT2 family glycosyltransferase